MRDCHNKIPSFSTKDWKEIHRFFLCSPWGKLLWKTASSQRCCWKELSKNFNRTWAKEPLWQLTYLSCTAASKFHLQASGTRGVIPNNPCHLHELKEHAPKRRQESVRRLIKVLLVELMIVISHTTCFQQRQLSLTFTNFLIYISFSLIFLCSL